MLGSVIDEVAGLKAITSRQTTTHTFFTRIDYLTQSVTVKFFTLTSLYNVVCHYYPRAQASRVM